MIIRSFVKCGLSNKLNGSEDRMVNIRGTEGYVMPKPESEFHLDSDSDSSESEYDEHSCDQGSLKVVTMHRRHHQTTVNLLKDMY